MNFKKNQVLELDITDLGKDGEGIGHIDGYALFVVGALPGERVRVKLMKCKKNMGYGKLLEILSSPADAGRVKPPCPVAATCGGCTLQHISYEKQLFYKEKRVKDCLSRLGKVDLSQVEWQGILGMEDPWGYRNKAQFPVGVLPDNPKEVISGFYAPRSHRLVPVSHCLISEPEMEPVLKRIMDWICKEKIAPYDEGCHAGVVRHIFLRYGKETGEMLVCLVLRKENISKEAYQALWESLMEEESCQVVGVCVNVNPDKTNVILGKKTRVLFGKGYIEDQIVNGDTEVTYHISPESFYQVNPLQTRKLYGKALEYAGLSGNECVWDLYCGIGTISLFLAKKARHVYGVEIVEAAVDNARENARLNNIDNVDFYVGKAEDVAEELMDREEAKPDVIVVDPARKGCDEKLLNVIRRVAPKQVVYVSCDPATLARDIKKLSEWGYCVKKGCAVDMFGQSAHIECVIKLQRRDM